MALLGGVAGLTWELLWQHHCSLALGISALGTAITLACSMAGMAVGSLLMGRYLFRHPPAWPLRVYGALELCIGLSGLCLLPGFRLLTLLDARAYPLAPALAPLLQLLGILLLLGPPTLAMGATVPVFRLLGPRHRTSIATLYALNTAGAAFGLLGAAFFVLPEVGVATTGDAAVCVNLLLAAIGLGLGRVSGPVTATAPAEEEAAGPALVAGPWPPARAAALLALCTGFATFALEVAWFRSLRAAFQSTSDSFAVMLAAVLLALSLGAWLGPPLLRRGPGRTGMALAVAGMLALLATPVVERFDTFAFVASSHSRLMATWLGASVLVLGLPMLALGAVLPALLERQGDTLRVGRLYGLNTLGAVTGSLLSAWLLLPTLGFARTAWLTGAVLLGCAVLVSSGRTRRLALGAGLGALGLAVFFDTGIGRLRVQGAHLPAGHRVLSSSEGPDSTVSVVEYPNGTRELTIDGFATAAQAKKSHYMTWMGRLPMIAHADPRRVLVICFGTGQTANGVRQEGGPALDLDIVDVNRAVFAAAPLFPLNQGVLLDPRAHVIAMDGRAHLRRTDRRYDVVTLEPMAPYFAGTNSLYSEEFYRLAATRLNPGGIVAQWLPLHILYIDDTESVAKTFRSVFRDTLIWLDPIDHMGILLGRVEPGAVPLGRDFPGLGRDAPGRDLTPEQVRGAVVLGPRGVRIYSQHATVITDDNQQLAYGTGRRHLLRSGGMSRVRQLNEEQLRHLAARLGPE